MHFGYVKNELMKRKRRAMFVIFGIALSIAVLVAVNSLADAFMNAAQKPLENVGADIIVQRSGDTPEYFEGATLPCAQGVIKAEEVNNLKNISGVNQMSTSLLMWVFESEDISDSEGFAVVTGIEPEKQLGQSKANGWVSEGASITANDSGVALVDSIYADQNGIRLSDDVMIANTPFKVIGIVNTPSNSLIGASNIYITLKDAQDIASKSNSIPGYEHGDVNGIFLQADPEILSDVTAKVDEAVKGATVTSPESFIQAIGGIAAQSRTLAVLVSIVVLLLSLIVVAKTISGNIMERRNEIGIMKTVGWTAKDISKQIISETFIQSIFGGIVGIGIGFLTALLLGQMQVSIPVSWDIDPYPHFMMSDMSEKALNVGLTTNISLGLIGLSLVIAVAVGVLSAILTLKNINKIKPSEVLRYE